jgi:uncharacterized circularly permuted ATP-grasp superfamily protein
MSAASETAEGQAPAELFTDYLPPPGVYDEVRGPDGSVRDSWKRFAQVLQTLGPQGISQRAEQAHRLLRENGVTYSVQGAPQGPDRPWELDPIPLLFSSSEWCHLAAGVEQRVTLLNRILADIYGPQELLRQRILPPAVVFGHPGWLVAGPGLVPDNQSYLQLYASHLARQPDGRWVVLAAVENRLVISRTLPQDFHSLHVERLASFFITLRETLQGLAKNHRDNPRIVILSPGLRSPTYFEDSYLARYLGYTLIEGGDLTVRGDRVYVKTLGGLLPVDVILRRIPDDDCDPLELRGDSPLSTPGLLQAIRGGQVVVANALGSGYLEAPALMAYLPAACRFLLGEELKLPSVPTWWCGRPDDLRYVEANWDRLIVRSAFVHRGAAPVVVRQLSRADREVLQERVRRRPERYVAQEPIERSTAPVWTGQQMQPWHVGLRVFATASAEGYPADCPEFRRVRSPWAIPFPPVKGARTCGFWPMARSHPSLCCVHRRRC